MDENLDKHITFEELESCNRYIADDGYVITNYIKGDQQIIYSKILIFSKTSTPSGYYTLLEEDAAKIADEVNPKIDEINKFDDIE